METDYMTTPAQYRTRWPHAATRAESAAFTTENYQALLRESARPLALRFGFAQSLFLAVLREAHQGEGSDHREMFAFINADNVPMEETAVCGICLDRNRTAFLEAKGVAAAQGDWDGSDDLTRLEYTEGAECLVCCYRPS